MAYPSHTSPRPAHGDHVRSDRQPYLKPHSSIGAAGHWIKTAGILAPLVIGEFVKYAEQRWRYIRLASVATALICEGLWTNKIHNERKAAQEASENARNESERIISPPCPLPRPSSASQRTLLPVETRSKSNYRAIVITPAQTLSILEKLINPLHDALTLTCAATALRAPEILALRWDDVLWTEGRIRISKRWAKGADGETKTEASDGYVPMHPLLSPHLKDWHRQTPYAKGPDFVFPSLIAEGKVPLNACSCVKDHLRVAAKASGVQIADGQRFGLHNLRHSLSNWLVNKGKVEPKTVQGLLRHSKIQTTLDLYTQEDSDETRAAQGAYLSAVGLTGRMIQ